MTPLQDTPTEFSAAAADPMADALERDAAAPSGIARNQADGLRTMFGQREPVVFCVASALSPDATVALGLGLLYCRITVLLCLRLVLQEHLLRLCSVRLLLRAQLFFLQCLLGGQLVFR